MRSALIGSSFDQVFTVDFNFYRLGSDEAETVQHSFCSSRLQYVLLMDVEALFKWNSFTNVWDFPIVLKWRNE